MSLEPGQILDGKYRVGRLIGEGGMGTVYEGEHSRIGRRVAIKVLHASVAAMPEFVERFEREARAAARIGSPHVCDVLDLGDLENGDRYIVMEYLDGVSLEDRLGVREKLTAVQLAPIAFELLEGLGTMHDARVIHRDLKPANVFLARTPSGRGEIVKILDFGVAKLQPFEGEVGTMTQTGTMMGTPLYMSPEQARGARDVDARADIYAASVIFYRALAGSLPYTADTLNELLFKIVLEDAKPLREVAPEVDEAFAAIVHKGLARNIDDRYATARAYQEAIAAWGRAQGRASLAFAVTIHSEPPIARERGSSPSLSAQSSQPAQPSSASGGTPIAWSEDGPRAAVRGPSQSHVDAVRPAAGAEPPNATSSSSPRVESSPSLRFVTQPNAAASHESPKPEPPTGDAATGESPGPHLDSAKTLSSPTDPRSAATTTAAKPSRSQGIAIGVASAVSVVGLVAYFAFGRTTAPSAVAESNTPPTSQAVIAAGTAVVPSPIGTAPTSHTEESTPEPVPSAAAASSKTEVATAPAVPAPPAPLSHKTSPAPRREQTPKIEPKPASSSSAPAVVASALPAVTPSAAPKATSSAGRKFRTNLD